MIHHGNLQEGTKMEKKKLMWRNGWSILILVGILILVQVRLEKNFVYPFPSISTLKNENISFLNFWGVLLGFRRLSADLAWIKVLQYYGTHEGEEEHGKGCHCHICMRWGEYEKLLPLCQLVVRLDPYFYFAYLYGGGALAYNHERYGEAISLLEEGIRNNPKYWRFNFYLAAIGYKIKNQEEKVIALLEQIIDYPDCPMMIRSILAQLYENNLQYVKAIKMWEYILETSKNEGYRKRAQKHLQKLNKLLK